MIGEEAFKGIRRYILAGDPCRVLFITPSIATRRGQQLDMLDTLNAWGFNPIWYTSAQQIKVEGSTIYLRTAHEFLDREMRGMEFTFIEGLEYLNAFKDGFRIKAELQRRVRS